MFLHKYCIEHRLIELVTMKEIEKNQTIKILRETTPMIL